MKRDTKYQLTLLNEIEEYDGALYEVSPPTAVAKEERVKKWQHLQLLVDEDLVEKRSDYTYRLTAMGHDALDLHRKGLIEKAVKKSGDIGLAILADVAKTILLSSVP